MADFDFEPPSFSLGLDLDPHSEPQPASESQQPANTPSASASASNPAAEEDDDFESQARVSDQPRALKRLRRGHVPRVTSETTKAGSEDDRCNPDDDIEDFSSEEDCSRGNLPTNSINSSSKPSLHRHKVVTSETRSPWISTKGKGVASCKASANVETKLSNLKFSVSSVSPLRRFQLIDSDSDDPSIENTTKDVPCVVLPPKDKQSDSGVGTKKTSGGMCKIEGLWKDFSSEKNFHIPTPALDEVCEEYFSSVKSKSGVQRGHIDPKCERSSYADNHPPSHHYYFHNDLRVQKLVRDRLPHFFPLVAGSNHDHKLPSASVIDYLDQFGHGENTRHVSGRPILEKGSTRNRKNAKKLQTDNVSQDSGWVDPKSCAGLTKNASNRRVQAVGKSAGHWYTDSSGQRVYVDKNGQELTGQIAYRHYRKESGMGLKNSKKKAAAKKKSGGRRRAAPEKK